MRIETKMAAGILLGAALSCTHDVTDPLAGTVEADALTEVEHALAPRLKAEFGAEARLQRIFGGGRERLLLGVATEPLLVDADAVPSVGVAAWDKERDVLSVVARDRAYKEAREHGDGYLLVRVDGVLVYRRADGDERRLTENVRGDLASAPDGALVAYTRAGDDVHDGETAVEVVDAQGVVRRLADDLGVDDRPTFSPDGRTVVFVSGRTGIASLWRTTVDGAPPVQVTNVGIALGKRDGPPDGFVPPPVRGDLVEWLSNDELRYDAGDGEMWVVDVKSGAARREGGA